MKSKHADRLTAIVMSSIRPLQRRDIPRVASLYESVMRSGSRVPAPQLAVYFEQTFLDHPWADAEIPSLVYETKDGVIVGFLGSHVRRWRFDGQPIRARYNGQLVADPAVPNRGAGALLLRSSLGGPQDVTITDGATVEVRQMWERFGATTVFLNSMGWARFFRPFGFGGDYLFARAKRPGWNEYLRPLWSVLDTAAAKICDRSLGVGTPDTRVEPLTSQTLLEHLPDIARRLRVHADYDREFLDWLFAEMARVSSRGRLVRQLVRDRGNRVLGWYVAYFPAGDIGEVQQLVAHERDIPAVMHQLFYDARHNGVTALRGRLEPRLFESVRRRHFHLRHEASVVIHSRNADLVSAVLAGDALLTRMDGEWWMGHHIEAFA